MNARSLTFRTALVIVPLLLALVLVFVLGHTAAASPAIGTTSVGPANSPEAVSVSTTWIVTTTADSGADL